MNRVGLVLGAGGVTGHAFHAGVLSAIADATGFQARDASHIVGTSAGSIVAAYLRAGFSAGDIAARLSGEGLSEEGRRLASKMGPSGREPAVAARPRLFSAMAAPALLARLSLQPWRARLGTVAAAALPPGLITSDHIVAGIERLFGDAWADKPLWVCAVSLDSGRLTVFGREGAPEATVGRAVQASCAIPSYFVPIEIDGVRYVDGGVHSPTNADVLAGEPLDLVIVSSPMSTVRGSRTIDYPMRALVRAVLAREVARLRRAGIRVVVLQPTPRVRAAMGLNALDGRRAAAVVSAARDDAARLLERADMRDRFAPLAQ